MISPLLLLLLGAAPPPLATSPGSYLERRFDPESEQVAREAYARAVRRDLRMIKRQCRFLDDVLTYAGQHQALLERAKDPRTVLSLLERRVLTGVWQQFYLGFSDLDALAQTYRLQVEGEGGHRHVDNYDGNLLSMTARVAKLTYGYHFVELTGDAKTLTIMFDEAPAGRGLERDTYSLFRARLFDLPDRLDLLHYAKYEVRRPLDPRREFSAAREDPWLERFWSRHTGDLIRLMYTEQGAIEVGDSEVTLRARRGAGLGLQTLVKPVAVFMGATKVRRLSSHLITESQIHEMLPRLEPGDLFLEKTTFYLSNFFITGFWGHTGLYTGSFDEAARYFDTPEVSAYFERHGHPSFAAFVEDRFPRAVAQWRRLDDKGAPMRVLEGDGVKANSVFFNTAEDAFGADYIALLRPRKLARLDKALAMVDALAYWRAEYDFDFDVRSDNALVCTELLAKAYAPDEGKAGVRFAVGDAAAGRYVVYPNAIAEQFANERGRPDQQLDFVYFLRALEGTRRAAVAGEEVFAESYAWESTL